MNRRGSTLRSRLHNDDSHLATMHGYESVDPESLTPEDYLDRFGITAYLREVLSLVLENRPQAPVEFVAEYFRNAVQGSSYLHRAYRLVCMTDRGRPGFLGNVIKAHQVLAHRKGSIGVTGEEMTKLLSLICHNFPSNISDMVLKNIFFGRHSPTDIIEFDIFYLSVNVCLLFAEQIEFARQYFTSMCMEDCMQTIEVSPSSLSSSSSSSSSSPSVTATSSASSSASTATPLNGTTPTTMDGTITPTMPEKKDMLHTTEQLFNGTRPLNTSLNQRASVEGLLIYLKNKNKEVSSMEERLELSSMEEELRKISPKNQGVSLEDFCTLLVKQALPSDTV